LMLRSRANALVSVRRVTEINAGRRTAGVDGVVVSGSRSKAEWVDWAQGRCRSWTAKPVRRVYVVRREALCCIPNAVGRNLEDRFWVQWLT
jgi:RNA-directed DNA polymerase